jgi:hypothetical protein
MLHYIIFYSLIHTHIHMSVSTMFFIILCYITLYFYSLIHTHIHVSVCNIYIYIPRV